METREAEAIFEPGKGAAIAGIFKMGARLTFF